MHLMPEQVQSGSATKMLRALLRRREAPAEAGPAAPMG